MTNEQINAFLSAPKDKRSEELAKQRINQINPRGLGMKRNNNEKRKKENR